MFIYVTITCKYTYTVLTVLKISELVHVNMKYKMVAEFFNKKKVIIYKKTN